MEENDVLIPQELIDIILTQFYRIYNDLGYGFLERVYQMHCILHWLNKD